MASDVKHDYHLVDPSPWPVVGSLSAFVLALGAIGYMHTTYTDDGMSGGLALGPLVIQGKAIMLIGFAMVLYTMLGWWRDVVKESRRADHTPVVQIGLRYGMVLFIASEVMFFVAWFWAFFAVFLFPGAVEQDGILLGQVARQDVTGGHWPPEGVHTLDPWHLPLMNTLILLTSGTTVTWAHHAVLHGDRSKLIQGLWLTIILGAAFSVVQGYEYYHILHDDLFREDANIYKSTFFMATGFHGAHVLIGTLFLIVCLVRSYAGHFTPEKHFGFEAAAWYWHFVDVVWLFLFACIYVWAGGAAAAGAGH